MAGRSYRLWQGLPGVLAQSPRATWQPVPEDSGTHICLRAREKAAVDAFYAAGLAAGGSSDGGPGFREQYSSGYYAAFIRDPDGNRVEAVTFITEA